MTLFHKLAVNPVWRDPRLIALEEVYTGEGRAALWMDVKDYYSTWGRMSSTEEQ